VLIFMLLIGLVVYQLYWRENEGFTGDIRKKIRPLIRNMRLKKEAMTKNIKRRYENFRR